MGRYGSRAQARQLEAKFLAAQDFFLGAEPAYRRAIQALADLGLKDAAAVATLELCAVWVRPGQNRRREDRNRKVVRHFRAACAGPEVLAALGLLRKAARAEAVTVALLEQAMAAVERRAAGRGR
ncbi:MAG TPA: hypothetical protein VGS22_14035 [Thermoanaerobaculia bacterium]|nr:hypothetical protein [Thermoanaerobaculia bacterium]